MSRTLLLGLACATLALGVGSRAALAQGKARTPSAAPPATSAPANRDPGQAAYEAAIEPGLGDSTRARLNRFLSTWPRHPRVRDAQFELGLLSYAEGDYAGARARFRRGRPPSGGEEARYWEALSSYALGDPRNARDAALPVARARRDVPRRWDCAYLVALSWAGEGRRLEALAAYRALFDLPPGPGQAAALFQAQQLARELQRTEDAADWRDRLLKGYPRSPEAASVRAEAQAAAVRAAPAAPPGTPAPATTKR